MGGKFWLAVVVVFIVFGALQFVVHGTLLSGWYDKTSNLWKPEDQMKSRMLWHFISQLVFAFLFCFIYSKGFEQNKGHVGQGLRYGIYMGLIVYLPLQISYYVVLNVPSGWFLAWQGFFNFLTVMISGIILGSIYRPAPKSQM
jgi:uncharacterized membrane protein YagU involved in acid resistance